MQMLKLNMNATSQAKPNSRPASSFKLTARPMIASRPPTPINRFGTLRQRDRSSGAAECEGCELISFLQGGLMFRRNVLDHAELRPVQRPQIGDDRPAVLRHDVRAVGTHEALAVGDGVEN